MTATAAPATIPFDLRSTAACIIGNMLLRTGSASAIGCINLYLAYLKREVHDVSAVFIGLLAMAFYTSELLFAPFFGSLSDRYGRKPFMLLGTVLGGLCVLVFPWSAALFLFVLVRVAEGLSSASSVPAVLSHLAGNTGGSTATRGRVMAVFEVATIVGFGLGLALGGLFWDRLHVNAFYAVSLVYGSALLAFTQVAGQAAAPGEHHSGWGVYRALLRHSSTLGFAPSWLTINAILGMWFAHVGFQLAQPDDPSQLLVGGFSGTQVGAITGGLALAFVVGTALWSLTFGRISNLRIMRISVGGLAATCGGLYLLNHSAPDATLAIVATAAVVVASLLVVSGFTPAALAHLAEISEGFHMNRGGVMGLYSVLLGLGQLIGGWTGGLFAHAWGIDGLIYATVIMGIIAYGSLQWLARTAPHSGAGAGTPAHRA